MTEPHPLDEGECCTSHQGICPTPLELLRWQRDQARVEAERLSELGQEWQARARVAEAEVERLRGVVARVEALAEEWAGKQARNRSHYIDGPFPLPKSPNLPMPETFEPVSELRNALGSADG